MIAATLVAAVVTRAVVGDWQITDAIVPVVMVAVFPFLGVGHPRVHPALAASPGRRRD